MEQRWPFMVVLRLIVVGGVGIVIIMAGIWVHGISQELALAKQTATLTQEAASSERERMEKLHKEARLLAGENSALTQATATQQVAFVQEAAESARVRTEKLHTESRTLAEQNSILMQAAAAEQVALAQATANSERGRVEKLHEEFGALQDAYEKSLGAIRELQKKLASESITTSQMVQLESQKREAEQNLTEVRTQMIALQTQGTLQRGKISDLQAQITLQQGKISGLTQENEGAENRLARYTLGIGCATQRIAPISFVFRDGRIDPTDTSKIDAAMAVVRAWYGDQVGRPFEAEFTKTLNGKKPYAAYWSPRGIRWEEIVEEVRASGVLKSSLHVPVIFLRGSAIGTWQEDLGQEDLGRETGGLSSQSSFAIIADIGLDSRMEHPFVERDTQLRLVIHELGHVFGLAHTEREGPNIMTSVPDRFYTLAQLVVTRVQLDQLRQNPFFLQCAN